MNIIRGVVEGKEVWKVGRFGKWHSTYEEARKELKKLTAPVEKTVKEK